MNGVGDRASCPYKLVSLFSGAGGLDLGFKLEGFETIWANDIDRDACETHRMWSHGEVVCADVDSLDFGLIPEADVIVGGFPCQGFSLAGPRKVDDSRNGLYRSFVKLVELQRPKMFVAENVKGILTLGNGSIIEAIVASFAAKGYDVTVNPCNAADYGVPQDRARVILVGVRNDLALSFKFPSPLQRKMKLRDALEGLPDADEQDVCDAPFSSRFMSRNRRRSWDERSYTIPAMAKQVPLHPSSPPMIKIGRDAWVFGNEGKTRRLSYREAAAIQTFPKDFEFAGNLTSKYKQIGNAVPVNLARAVAHSARACLDGRE